MARIEGRQRAGLLILGVVFVAVCAAAYLIWSLYNGRADRRQYEDRRNDQQNTRIDQLERENGQLRTQLEQQRRQLERIQRRLGIAVSPVPRSGTPVPRSGTTPPPQDRPQAGENRTPRAVPSATSAPKATETAPTVRFPTRTVTVTAPPRRPPLTAPPEQRGLIPGLGCVLLGCT